MEKFSPTCFAPSSSQAPGIYHDWYLNELPSGSCIYPLSPSLAIQRIPLGRDVEAPQRFAFWDSSHESSGWN